MSEPIQLPPLGDELGRLLGRPCFACGELADMLRAKGHEIRRKAEDEQAAVIHFTVNLWLLHGDGWIHAADAYFAPTTDHPIAKPGEGHRLGPAGPRNVPSSGLAPSANTQGVNANEPK